MNIDPNIMAKVPKDKQHLADQILNKSRQLFEQFLQNYVDRRARVHEEGMSVYRQYSAEYEKLKVDTEREIQNL